jgi:hypothetical protein
LRCNPEGIRHAIEKGKQRGDVDGFGNLGLTPTVMAQDLHVFRGGAIRCLGHLGDIFQQGAVRVVKPRLFEVARSQRVYCFLFCSLNPQEVCMRIQSIGTAIEPRDPTGNRFLGPTREVPFRKMDRIAEAHDLPQEIGTMAKALENAGHLLAARMGAPFVIYLRDLASRVRILDQIDFCLRVGHGSRWPKISIIILDHQALVAHFARNSLPVKILQQGDGILSRQAGYLFEAGYVHRLPV